MFIISRCTNKMSLSHSRFSPCTKHGKTRVIKLLFFVFYQVVLFYISFLFFWFFYVRERLVVWTNLFDISSVDHGLFRLTGRFKFTNIIKSLWYVWNNISIVVLFIRSQENRIYYFMIVRFTYLIQFFVLFCFLFYENQWDIHNTFDMT